MKAHIRFLLPILIGALFLSSEVSAQWSTYAAMPGTRWAHVCAPAGGNMYVVAGSTGPTWEYDPVGNSWATRASIPNQRSYPGVASWGGMIYVLGGSVGAAWSNLNERYDPATDTWTSMANMPQVRTTTAAAAVNNKIYVMNGWNGTAMTALDIYDIPTNTWTSGAPAPTGRSHAKTAVVNNRIYMIGGYAGGWTNINEVYDPATNTWATMAPMPTARYIHAVGAIGTKIFVAGGYAGGASNILESYDVLTNTWTTEASMPTARYRTDGAAVNGCFYVLGGYNGSNLSTNEGFCSVVLPVALELKGWESGELVELQWNDRDVEQVDHYVVERGSPGGNFEEIGRIEAGSELDGHFQFMDHGAMEGMNLYRLRRVDLNGNAGNTVVVEVEFGRMSEVRIGWDRNLEELVLRWGEGKLSGLTKVQIFDLRGHQIANFEFNPDDYTARKAGFPISKLVEGMYLARISTSMAAYSKRLFLERI